MPKFKMIPDSIDSPIPVRVLGHWDDDGNYLVELCSGDGEWEPLLYLSQVNTPDDKIVIHLCSDLNYDHSPVALCKFGEGVLDYHPLVLYGNRPLMSRVKKD